MVGLRLARRVDFSGSLNLSVLSLASAMGKATGLADGKAFALTVNSEQSYNWGVIGRDCL
jgi:hypothetical protein